jgi:hypothetical protein
VWALPVVAIAVAAVGLALAFQHWSRIRRGWTAEGA